MTAYPNERNLRQIVGFDTYEFGLPITLNQSSFSWAGKNRSHRLWKYLFHKIWIVAKGAV